MRNSFEMSPEGDARTTRRSVRTAVRTYRLRDGQIKELDSDVSEFKFAEAKVDTMLATLTATAPVKRSLASRSALYANIQRTLKKSGQLERGLLDGLK